MTTFSRTVHGVRKTKKQREERAQERRRGETTSEQAKGRKRENSLPHFSLPSRIIDGSCRHFYALLSPLDVLRPPLLKVYGGGVDTELLDLSLCVETGEGRTKSCERWNGKSVSLLRHRQDANAVREARGGGQRTLDRWQSFGLTVSPSFGPSSTRTRFSPTSSGG